MKYLTVKKKIAAWEHEEKKEYPCYRARTKFETKNLGLTLIDECVTTS